MELNLEVVLSSSIKRKKPWPRFCWLGQEKESVFLLDDKRISEINMVSGRTKKRTPKLHPLLSSVVTMASSHSGTWLCGVLVSGELFLWKRDKDLLKSAAPVPEVVQVISHAQGKSIPLRLQVSDDGMHVLLVAITGQVFLWECMDVRDLTGVRDGTVKGCWAHIKPLEDTILPSPRDKEASQHSIFVKTEAMGDACLLALVFTSGKKLIITCLKIQWEEGHMRLGSVGYNIQWATKTYTMSQLMPPCQPVKSRGALVPAFSPDGQLLAIALNQRQPKATQVLYVSTQNFVSVSSGLGGCGIKTVEIPSKYIRSYWVGSVSWSPSSLFLACVLKRGSFLMLVRLGGLLTLTTSGCNVDFGPAHFLPLHPLVTYWPPVSAGKGEASLSSSSLSVQDVLRQRYSVTWHPRLFYLIVSDGYMATVMRVLDRPSPPLLLKTLLKETTRDLEKASQILDQSQIHVRAWLESVSSLNHDSSSETLNPSVTYGPNTADSIFSAATDGSTLPLFLQDTGTMGGTKGLLEKMQTFLEDDSDLDGPPAGSHIEDGGRLEFASMFDTLHALDTHTDTGLVTGSDYKDFVETEEKNFPHRELGKIQSKLLTAWAFGMSVGNGMVEHRAGLLRHNLFCVVRLAALFHLIPSSSVHTEKKNTSVFARLLHLIKALLSFLHWDHAHADGPCCLGLMVEFSKRLVHLLLTPHPEFYQTGHFQLSSQSLSNTLNILQLVSQSLDDTYSLQQRTVWSSMEKEPPSKPLQLWPLDVHNVLLLQDEKEKNLTLLHSGQPVPQRPSSRLMGVWQWVYKITQQYLDELKGYEDCDGWEEEQEQLSVMMSQMQTALQSAGGRLEEGLALLGYPGEHLFLCGLYQKSADAWQSQIHEDTNKNSDRRVFLEKRLCLALLYSLLFQYRLREAQELGDHMANLILHRAGHQKDDIKHVTADSLPCSWLPVELHCDTAFAVVQSLGRFMASYFANQPLHILPPHNVTVLPPLHLPHAPSIGRLVPLCQEEVSTAVRRQHLSEVWTVDYTQDLLLLGGLLPEAVWLADHLGDWKMAVSLSLAYKSYCTDNIDFARLRRRELHLPTALEAENIFQAELECLLNNKPDSQEHTDKNDDKSFTEPLEGQDWDLLLVSIQEILKASVMAGVNVMSSPLSSLLDTAKDSCSCLPMLVPSGLYLPSPPLYCPQPSPNTQDPIRTIGQFAEIASRHTVSGVLQRLLLLLRSARCCHPAAQWYITHLRRARHLLYKIKKKYSYPGGAKEERAFPEGLMKFVTRSGFFRRGPNKDGHLDPDIIQTISSFRELCALCWMLHVRDQLSISCRKYQATRQFGRDEQVAGVAGDSEVRSCCVEALRWARRFLPFSRFLNAEEILQDLLLSLVSELPPIPLLADTLVEAFPEEEESVRVSLREKYNSLLQRLRHCNVLEGEKEEMNELMMILIQDKHRQRRKHLGRLRRHLAPTELHLWEKEEEVEDRGSKHGMAMLRQLSLGTSLSTSTLTDCGFPPVYSDGDTAETTSEAILPENHCRSKSRHKKGYKIRAREDVVKIESAIQEKSKADNNNGYDESSLPVVGTWEFELDDEEFLNFLELFLSYELEKDSADGGDQGSELPLLKSFSKQLKERELHSLTFDVLTTIHRRQREGHHPGDKHRCTVPPVFRAGSCYRPIKGGTTPEPQTSSIWSEAPMSKTSHSVSSFPGLRNDRQKGLFGLRKQTSVPITQRMKGSHCGSETSPIKSTFPVGQPSESLILSPSTSVEPVIELQQGLDPKLEAQFPQLGRLLEWMVRWADRRMLLGHHGKKKKDRGGGVGGINDEGVVIRVKSSAPAVLTSLSLLEWRYTTLLGTDCYSAHIQVPETQWTVAPVLQPEVDRKLERDSSIDTGYPGSASTPLTGLDHNIQQGEVSIGCCTDEPEELACDRMHLPHVQHQHTFYTSPGQSSFQQPPPDDLDVTPEKEGKSSCSDISEGICTPAASLKLAELDFSLPSAEDILTSTSLHSLSCHRRSLQAPAQPQPQPLPVVQPEVSVHSEVTESIGMTFSTAPADPSTLQPQRSMAGAPTGVSTAANQPPFSQSQPMRQRLGEDLFHLVQNINYMSLMEVLGASFSNLQLAQQSCSLAQSNMNFSQPNVPPSYGSGFIPQRNAFPVQPTVSVAPQPQASVSTPGFNKPYFSQAPACVSAGQPAGQSSGNKHPTYGPCQITSDLSTSASGACGNNQEMCPLSLNLESPEFQFKQSRKLIPPSQGLLATADSQTVPSAPVLPPHGSFRNDTASQVFGLKLLQLQCPSLPQQIARHYPPVKETEMTHIANTGTQESNQPKLRHSHQAGAQRAKDEKRITSSVPRRQLGFNHTHEPDRNWHPQIHTSEISRGREFFLPRPTLPVHTPAPTQGLRLLHFQPASQSNIIFPKLPMPFSSRPSTVIRAPVGETPLIKLLHIESGPKMILPMAAPTRMTRLISMDELTSSVIRSENNREAQPQLLKVNPPAESTSTASTSFGSNSSKRQRRREEKAERARKTVVTFRENESIIPTQKSTDEPAKVAEEITPAHNFAFPPGSFDCLLTGQSLLDKAMSTSAELHAFASTCKTPPECKDAFTNTDSVCPPNLVDKNVSTFVTSTSPESQSTQNCQDSNEHIVQDINETPKDPEKIQNLPGHQFISVLDLEDKSLHHDLPLCLSVEAQDGPSIQPSSPTSAQLHALATSVIRSAAVAAADPQPSISDNFLKPTTQPDIPEESHLPSHIESATEPERIIPQDVTDPFDSEIFQAIKKQSVGPHRTSSSPPTAWFSSRLSELDVQLAALQKIADYLENDFSNSRMLVNTIENLTPVLVSDVKRTMAVKKTVRLSVPKEAWTPQSDVVIEPNTCKEEEESRKDKHVVHSDSHTTEGNAAFHHFTPSHHHRAEMKSFGISPVLEEEDLGQTGLLDTIEILDELVKEGYLSPTELDLSTSQTAHDSSSLHQQQRSMVSEKRGLPEDERRELRMWMRRKQRERLTVYQKHKESLREREQKPFSASGKATPTNRNKSTIWRTRGEKEKFMLLKQYNQRIDEACSLASGFSNTPAVIRKSLQPEVPPLTSTAKSTSTPPFGSTYRAYSTSANDKSRLKPQLRQTQPPHPRTAEVQRQPSEDHSSRLGLHRPVTSLPRDRQSQVTRRGMLTDTKNNAKLRAASQSEERDVDRQRKTRLNKTPLRGSEIHRDQTNVKDGEDMTLWEPSSELNKMLGQEESESNTVVARMLDMQGDGGRAGVPDMDWLDNLSETASSNLSKIDWAAIERMVAGEED